MDDDVYLKLLEEKFLTYKELSSVAVIDNGEPMVKIGSKSLVRVFSIDKRMKKFTGDDIFVRKSLIQRLRSAQDALSSCIGGCTLEVVYGYRHPLIQREFFEDIRKRLTSKKKYADEEALKEEAHHFIAVPEVAGHPTGGAVDIRIVDAKGKPLDMGTGIHEFVKASYVYWSSISKDAWHNRQILRLCMTTAGFAPFDGEWWHFSYGDREWAKYYGKPNAIYGSENFQVSSKKYGRK